MHYLLRTIYNLRAIALRSIALRAIALRTVALGWVGACGGRWVPPMKAHGAPFCQVWFGQIMRPCSSSQTSIQEQLRSFLHAVPERSAARKFFIILKLNRACSPLQKKHTANADHWRYSSSKPSPTSSCCRSSAQLVTEPRCATSRRLQVPLGLWYGRKHAGAWKKKKQVRLN